MAKLRGGDPQFTYDFGLAVSTQTISRLTRLTGATLSLAGAYYALQKTSSEYMDTLRSNSLRFGGYLNTMRAISEAQDRIIKGTTRYSVKDQLKGLNDLMAVGLDARKEFDLVNKGAHALGVEFSDFAGAISNGIRGNMSALVQMGLLTERSVRYFEKYPANTIMRQQAILKFVKEHKGLQSLIKNDFKTIADETSRISTVWKTFLKSIVGDPRNPDSLYGSVVRAFGGIADGLKGYIEYIKRAGYMIGRVLGWVVRQVGKFVQWLGRTAAHAFRGVKSVLDNYKDATASIIVWLEFWKLRVIKFFKEYQEPIKTTLKLLIAYKALKSVFVISKAAIASAWAYSNALAGGIRAPFVRAKWRTGRMIVDRRRQGSLVKQGVGRGSWGRRWMYLKNMFMRPSTQTRVSAALGVLGRIGNITKTIGATIGRMGLNLLKIGGKGLLGSTLGAMLLGWQGIKVYVKQILGLSDLWDNTMGKVWGTLKAIGRYIRDDLGRVWEKVSDKVESLWLSVNTGWNNLIYNIKKTWRDFTNWFTDTDVYKFFKNSILLVDKAKAATVLMGTGLIADKATTSIDNRNAEVQKEHDKKRELTLSKIQESRVLRDLSAARLQAFGNKDLASLYALASKLQNQYSININAPAGMDVEALSTLIIEKIEQYTERINTERSARSGKD